MNSAFSRETGPPSAVAAEASEAGPSSGRVASSTLSSHTRMTSSTHVDGMTILRGTNSISFGTATATRKRPLDALSPLPSPLFTFMSPALTASSSSSSAAASSSLSMSQFDLSSSRSSSVATGANPLMIHRDLQATAVGNNSLKFVVPSGIKRVRREAPTSPCSVGEVNATVAAPSAAATGPARLSTPSLASPAVAPSASSEKIRSVVRGLEHVSRCTPSGCSNPLCVSTRGFMTKVSAHLVAMANKPGHIAERCGACQLWHSIVRSHASICMEVNCNIPLCATANEKPGSSVETSTGCRHRRDDTDDQRRSLVAQQ